ncbi:MAG: STAS domain-containing protein [Ruminococcaceae bacterium]|nr:STAS domain-containing protein [Oscillospiraceae bacterium]
MQAIGEETIGTGQVQAEYASGVLTLSVTGDIDHHGAAALRKSVDREIYYYRPKLVLMKLDGVAFMDSAGLGFFMGRYELCRTLGCAFRLLDPPPRVLKILELSGMDKKLAVDKVYRGSAKNGCQGASEDHTEGNEG